MDLRKDVSFHEATVVEFCQNDGVVKLELDEVLVNGVNQKVVVVVSSTFGTLVDGAPSNSYSLMAYDDGEVLSLDVSKGILVLLIEWNDFDKSFSVTKSYEISGKNICISVVG